MFGGFQTALCYRLESVRVMREESKGHWRGIPGMDAKGSGLTPRGCIPASNPRLPWLSTSFSWITAEKSFQSAPNFPIWREQPRTGLVTHHHSHVIFIYPTPAGPHCAAAAFLGHSHPLGSHREGELPFALHHLPLFY